MKDKIQTESYHYCQWYDEPPTYIRCPYLLNKDYCTLYRTYLENEEATDSWSGRDRQFIERCDKCKNS